MPGPYVNAALFCERVLTEQDGVLTFVRVVDRFMVQASGPEGLAPAELPEGGALQLTLVLVMKADEARGRYPVTIRPQLPSGAALPEQTVDMMFEGEDRGVNLVANLAIPAVEGLYWFDIVLNANTAETLLTRVPLRVIYQRIPAGG